MTAPDFDTDGWRSRSAAAGRYLVVAGQQALACEFLVLSEVLPLYSQQIINGEMTADQWRELGVAWQRLAAQCRRVADGARSVIDEPQHAPKCDGC